MSSEGSDFTQDQQEAIITVNYISTALSLVGEFLMLGTHYFSKNSTKSFSMNLVMGLVFSDFCYSFVNLLVIFRFNPKLCYI